MQCPKCKCDYMLKTVDSRPTEDGHTRRRRECVNCGARFSTMEITEKDYNRHLRIVARAAAFCKEAAGWEKHLTQLMKMSKDIEGGL